MDPWIHGSAAGAAARAAAGAAAGAAASAATVCTYHVDIGGREASPLPIMSHIFYFEMKSTQTINKTTWLRLFDQEAITIWI